MVLRYPDVSNWYELVGVTVVVVIDDATVANVPPASAAARTVTPDMIRTPRTSHVLFALFASRL